MKTMMIILAVVLVLFTYPALTNLNGEVKESERHVDISSFTASVTENYTIMIEWVSETETNLLGYHIVRAESNQLVEAEVVTPFLIDATNTSQPAQYDFEDETVVSGHTYYYWLQIIDLNIVTSHFGPVSASFVNIDKPVYYQTELKQNFPNPFNPNTTISFNLNIDSLVTLEIFNTKGQKINTLVSSKMNKGTYNINWDGKDNRNQFVSSGVYFYRLTTDETVQTQRMLLAK